MENVFDLGKTSYKAAPPPKEPTFSEHVSIIIETFFDIVKVIILSIPYCVDALVYLIIPRPKKNVAGQVALITGAGNGIGKQIALRLAREGCKIAIVDIEKEAALITANEICLMGGKAKGYHVDISDYDAVQGLREQVQSDFGPVDILVNNAGIIPKHSLREGTVQEIKRIVDVNVNAVIFMSRMFLETMIRRRSGHIMNLSSMASYHAIPGGIVYTTTKFAVRGFSEALDQELRLDGFGNYIHVTAVHPYFVATRKDLMDCAAKLRFPAMTAETVANLAIDGMLRNQLHVCIPSTSVYGVLVLQMLPQKIHNLIRDYVLREKDIREFWKKPNGLQNFRKIEKEN